MAPQEACPGPAPGGGGHQRYPAMGGADVLRAGRHSATAKHSLFVCRLVSPWGRSVQRLSYLRRGRAPPAATGAAQAGQPVLRGDHSAPGQPAIAAARSQRRERQRWRQPRAGRSRQSRAGRSRQSRAGRFPTRRTPCAGPSPGLASRCLPRTPRAGTSGLPRRTPGTWISAGRAGRCSIRRTPCTAS